MPRRPPQCRLFSAILGWSTLVATAAPAADTPGGLAAWFDTVAEAQRLAEQGAGQAQPGKPAPQPAGQPATPGRPQAVALTVDPQALRALFAKRHGLVDDSRLFESLRQLARGEKPSDARLRNLPTSLQAWFATYFEMLAFLPQSRADVALPEVRRILEDEIRGRNDFVEGRVMASVCHLYAGDRKLAEQRLQEATSFLKDHLLYYSILAQDCCYAWLLIGEPKIVTGYIADLEELPKPRRTPYQSMLIAIYNWQSFRYNAAKESFEEALQKAAVFAQGPRPGTDRLAVDAAFFYLVAGTDPPRDPKRGARLLDCVTPANQSWPCRRARAALYASQADWNRARQELQACVAEALPVVSAEISEQLAAYDRQEEWVRKRPPAPPKKK